MMHPETDEPLAEWSGVEFVPRTQISCSHTIRKRLAELEMNGFSANQQFAIRLAIDQAIAKALAAAHRTNQREQIEIRWRGKGQSFHLSIDGETVVDHQQP